MTEIIRLLFDTFVMSMTILAMTSALIDYLKTIPPEMDIPNPPKLGRIPQL